ncbi:MAG TPA: DNA-processing protein DprA, partial [Microbacterium sp.]|nr:DNA-processing protein DprA [Microbacterium sp.]
SGAVAAEVPCGTTPTRFRFLARNRLIAALSDATVVVEAGWRSGARNTANHAREIGRPLGVVPGPITSASSMGCHRLLRESDAVCITGPDDVRELVGLSGDTAGSLFDAGPYTDHRTRILDALSARTARSTDDIARRGGFDPDEAAALLGMLELDGAVHRSPIGWSRVPGH